MSNLNSNLESYNSRVKDIYKIDEDGMEFLIQNELNTEALIPYYEIPSNETLSGHAEIFEPELDDE